MLLGPVAVKWVVSSLEIGCLRMKDKVATNDQVVDDPVAVFWGWSDGGNW